MMSFWLIFVAWPKIRSGLLFETIVFWPFLEKAVLHEEKKSIKNRIPTHTHT